ncbi:MAG: hypothetical protein Q7R95_11390 [bacterium]|nr:hypothetical protein [bacterium]
MNKKHFDILASKYYKNLNPDRIEFLKNLRDLIDTYEQNKNDIVGISVLFDALSDKKEFTWDGQTLS